MSTPVTTAVRRELRALDRELARSSLAMSALALARRLDDPVTPPSAVQMTARELRLTLDRLAERAAGTGGSSLLDELADRRAERRAS